MNDLVTIYELFKDFGDSHRMVNEFKLLTSTDELSSISINHRGLYINFDGADLDRDNNNPTYIVTFNIIVVDKVPSNDQGALILSNQENLFVISQLQDYFNQILTGEERFDQISTTGFSLEDHNVTSAVTSCDFVVSRAPYNREINM